MSNIKISMAAQKAGSKKVLKNAAAIIVLLFISIFIMSLVSGCKSTEQKQTESPDSSSVSESADTESPDSLQSEAVVSGSSDDSETTGETEADSSQNQTSAAATQTDAQTIPTTTVTTTTEQSATIKVTIPEGYSLVQICQQLDAAGVNSFDKLFASATTDDFSDYSAISEAGFPANRCFQLEGYLFPDTYVFYRDENPKSVWGRFLQNFSVKTESYRGMLNQFGWTMDQAVVFASLLEREAGNENEVAKVSSVMHNRLETGMKLQLDASIVYVESYIKPYISGDINRFNAYYNTYKTDALPAGPICNPGLRALNAALNPADTDFYYFANDNAEPPNYYYSTTLEEHQAILEQYDIG